MKTADCRRQDRRQTADGRRQQSDGLTPVGEEAENVNPSLASVAVCGLRSAVSKRIILGMTGASGAVYGLRLLELLLAGGHEVHLVMSPAWHQSAAQEGFSPPQASARLTIYEPHNFNVPIASGSAPSHETPFDGMVIAPCSGSTLGCIASGINQHLIHRAAEVQLKERRRLILLVRESPLSLIHIQNMERVTLAGGIIQIAAPHFYTAPQTIQDVVDTVVERTMQLLYTA